MAGTTLATAYVAIAPSMKGLKGSITKEFTGATPTISKTSAGWGAAVKKGMKIGTGAVAGLGAAVAGLAIKGGISRLMGVEDATAKIKGLGYTGKQAADIITGSVTPAVKGTIYTTGEAANVAAGALASGIKPGKELTSYLRLTADAAGQAGVDFGSMGTIMNKVQGSGRVMGDTLMQLEENGLPASSILAKAFGTTQQAVRDMASKGQISAEQFRAAMQDSIGGAAKKASETTRGAFANMVSSFSITGQNLMQGAFPFVKEFFNGTQALMEKLQPIAKEAGAWLGDKLGDAVGKVSTKFSGLWESLKGIDWGSIVGPIKDIGTAFSPLGIAVKALGPALPQVGDALGKVAKAVGGALAKVLPTVAAAFTSIGTAVAGAISQALPALVPVFEALADVVPVLAPALDLVVQGVAWLAAGAIKLVTPLLGSKTAIVLLVGALVAWKGAQAGIAFAGLISGLAGATRELVLNTAAWAKNLPALVANKWETLQIVGLYVKDAAAKVASRVATVAMSGANKAAAAAQWLLNAAMNANPMGLLITAIGAVVAALVLFFTKTEVGQKIVKVAWGAIKTAIKAVGDWFTKTLWPAMKRVLDALGGAFRALRDVVAKVWDAISGAIGKAWAWVRDKVMKAWNLQIAGWKIIWANLRDTIQRVWNAIKSAISAVWGWLKKNVFNTASNLVGKIGSAFRNVRDTVKGVWDTIKSKVSGVWTWLKKNVFNTASSILGKMGDAFRGVRDAVKTSWNKIKEYAASPINFVLKTVYNDGLAHWWNTIANALNIKKWKLPAATPIKFAQGTEDHRAQIARGGAMRLWAEPETGGEAYIPLARSKRARSTSILGNVAQRFGYNLTPFAKGGFWNAAGGLVSKAWRGAVDLGGKAWDLAKKAGGVVLDFVKDPSGTVTKVAGALVNKLLGSQPGGDLMKMIADLPGKAVKGLADSVKSLVTGAPDDSEGRPGSGGGGSGGRGGMGWRAMWAIAKKLVPGTVMTSNFRGGAYTATGYPSYHGRGRAIDLVGNKPKIWEALRAGYGRTSAELFYTPKGFMRFGKMGGAAAVTRRMHYSHVHWAMKNGGLLFDDGGWLPTGRSVVENKTGRPEPVLTPRQWDLVANQPKELVVRDVNGQLIGRMRVEAGKVATGKITPVHEGRARW